MQTLLELQQRAWETSEKHGFHGDDVTFGDRIALIHSELSEALEDFRARGEEAFLPRVEYSSETGTPKPEGVGAELADAIIRIFDTAEEYGIDLEAVVALKMEYNDSRPFKHGGKHL